MKRLISKLVHFIQLFYLRASSAVPFSFWRLFTYYVSQIWPFLNMNGSEILLQLLLHKSQMVGRYVGEAVRLGEEKGECQTGASLSSPSLLLPRSLSSVD